MTLIRILYSCLLLGAAGSTVANDLVRALADDAVQRTTQAPARLETTLPIDHEFQPSLGTYHYDVIWRAAKVGEARITIARDGDYYRIAVRAETTSAIDRVFKVRYRGESRMTAGTLEPVDSSTRERVRKKKKNTRTEFKEDGSVAVEETKSRDGKRKRTKSYEIESEDFVVDPFTAVCLARRLEWEPGMTEIFEILSGHKRYELRLDCKGRETIENLDGVKREAWVIIPRIHRIRKDDKQDLEGVSDAKPRLYLSTDGTREVLELEGYPKVGRVQVRMREFQPAED